MPEKRNWIDNLEILGLARVNTISSMKRFEEIYFENTGSLEPLNIKENVDMIIGGPPCQAYSLLGRHRKEMEDDPRTLLYLQYGKFLKEFAPKGFVFENVPGILSAEPNGISIQKVIREQFNV